MMRRFVLNPGVIFFLVLYAGGLVVLSRNSHFAIADALVELGLFGMILPLLAWATTRRATRLAIPVKRSGHEMVLVLGLLVALAVYLIHGPQGIDALLPAA